MEMPRNRFLVVELDEMCYLDENIVEEVGVFSGVYLFDTLHLTRICSQQKHWFLYPLYPNANAKTDELRDRLEEEWREASDADYFVPETVKSMAVNWHGVDLGFPDADVDDLSGDDYRQLVEDLIQEYSANCVL